MSVKKRWSVAVGLIVIAGSLGLWWFFHDPFHGLSGHVVSDDTVLYRADGRFFLTPRRVRIMFLKDLTIPSLYSSIKAAYPTQGGWHWTLSAMPTSFVATKPIPGEREPERVFATSNSEGILELSEVRVMSAAEVQVVKRSQGSDAFIMNPNIPSPHVHHDNPRLAFGG